MKKWFAVAFLGLSLFLSDTGIVSAIGSIDGTNLPCCTIRQEDKGAEW